MFLAFPPLHFHFRLVRHVFCLVCLFLLLLPMIVGSSPAFAAEPVRVGVYQNEPLVFVDERGRTQGFAIDILQAVAEEEGWTLSFVPGTWAEGLQRLVQGEIDLLAAVAFNGERSDSFAFNEVPLLLNWGRLYRGAGTNLDSVLDLDGKTVSLLENDIHALVFRKLAADFHIRIEPLWVKEYADVLRSVEEGRAAAGVVNRLVGLRLSEQFRVVPTSMMFNPVKVHFAAPRGESLHLLQALDHHLRRFKADRDSVYFAALAKWLGESDEDQGLPGWAKLGGALLIGALLLAVAFIALLRWQVRSRTERLKNQVDQCELMRDQVMQREEELKHSLERYEKLFRAHRSVILLVDPNNGALVDANPAACEFYGYDRDELLAMRNTDINQLPAEEVFRCMRQALEQDKRDFRLRHRLKNGDIRDVDVSTSKIHLDGRTLLCSIVHDVTERLKLDEMLIHASEEWSSTFDALPDIIIILDTERNILRLNRAAAEFAGRDFAETLGRPCQEIFTENLEPCSFCPSNEVLEKGRVHTEEIAFPSRGVVFQKTSAPIFDTEGNLEKLVIVAKDISERRRLEEQLLHAQKMEAVGTLAGGVAHDFNNILSAIIGFAEIAKLELPDDSKALADIDEVLLASRRAADLIKQILTFSRQDSAARDVFQPHLVIKEALKMLRSSVPSTVHIEEDIDPESGFIEASTGRLQQLFMNLCTNAMHALLNEKGTLKIGLHREELKAADIDEPEIEPGPFVVLTVADDGCGMPPEIVERIFEPYFTTKTIDRGTGLGLAVVHGIVTGSGGFIRVDSRPGEGSTFRVYLPAVSPPERERPLDRDTEIPPGGHEHILVVDDETAILEINRSMLQNLGYRVTVAPNAAEALGLLKADPKAFDLVITDQTMPDMTGSELAREAMLLRPDLPIILCTGYSSQVSEPEARELGIRSFLMKPVDFRVLARTVRSALDS